jgi:hypothetical protein
MCLVQVRAAESLSRKLDKQEIIGKARAKSFQRIR